MLSNLKSLRLPVSLHPPGSRLPGGGRTLAALIAVGALTGGCHNFEKPKYEVGDRRLLLVPFRDLSVPRGHGYGESPRGDRLIMAFRRKVEREWEPYFADARSNDMLVRELREWTKPKITSNDWKKLLTGMDADFVLIGEIRRFQTRDPKSIGFHKGTAMATYTLVDTATGRDAYRSTEVEVEFPPPKDLTMPMSEFGTTEKEVEEGLLKLLGEEVAKELFGYPKV